MRYLSLVFLLILMGWSWAAVHRPPLVSEWIHWSLQEELKKVIVDRVHLHSVNKVQFQKLWTENLKNNQIKVHFHYAYEKGASDSEEVLDIQGYAILESEGSSSWQIRKLHIFNESIVFKKGMTIRPSDNQSDNQ